MHHFKLVAAAVALMVEDAMGQIETGIKALFQTERSSTVFIDIWKKAYPDTFFAGYEMMLLARHDPELKREWLYQSKRFAIRRKEVLMNLFPADVAVNEAYPFLEAVADFFRGMKVMEVVRTEEESRAVIKSIGRLFDAELTRIAKLRIS